MLNIINYSIIELNNININLNLSDINLIFFHKYTKSIHNFYIWKIKISILKSTISDVFSSISYIKLQFIVFILTKKKLY